MDKTEEESVLMGAGQISSMDEKTLACSPAPVTASTVMRTKCPEPRIRSRLKPPSQLYCDLDETPKFRSSRGSFEPSESMGSDERDSLGLIPNKYLIDVDNSRLTLGSLLNGKSGSISPFDEEETKASAGDGVRASQPSAGLGMKKDSVDPVGREDTLTDLLTISSFPRGSAPDIGTSGEVVGDSGREITPSLGSSTGDSNIYLTTVKKCNQDSHPNPTMESPPLPLPALQPLGEHAPQRLFESISPAAALVEEEEEGVGEAEVRPGGHVDGAANTGLADAVFASVLSRVNEDADHTVHQVALDAEDVEELEEVCFDFDEPSSDEEHVGVDQQPEADQRPFDDQEQEDVKSAIRVNQPQTGHPALQTSGEKLEQQTEMLWPHNTESIRDPSFSEFHQKSMRDPLFSEFHQKSIRDPSFSEFHQMDSTTEWGPSLEFGKTVASFMEETSPPHTEPVNPASTSSAFGLELRQSGGAFANFGDFAASPPKLGEPGNQASTSAFGLELRQSGGAFANFGDFAASPPKLGVGDNIDCFGGSLSSAFDGEEFNMDGGAAAAFLDEDEALFNKENFLQDELGDKTLACVRNMDQTFMNMTIGAYMAAGSGPLGSTLSSQNSHRPDLGIPIQSPPVTRRLSPISQQLVDIESSCDFPQDSRRLSPVGCGSPETDSERLLSPFGAQPAINSGAYSTSMKDASTSKSGLHVVDSEKDLLNLDVSAAIHQGQSALHLREAEAQSGEQSWQHPSGGKGQGDGTTNEMLGARQARLSTHRHIPVVDDKSYHEEDSVELTFSHLHKLMDQSDFTFSELLTPGQDRVQIIMAELRRHAREKKNSSDEQSSGSSVPSVSEVAMTGVVDKIDQGEHEVMRTLSSDVQENSGVGLGAKINLGDSIRRSIGPRFGAEGMDKETGQGVCEPENRKTISQALDEPDSRREVGQAVGEPDGKRKLSLRTEKANRRDSEARKSDQEQHLDQSHGLGIGQDANTNGKAKLSLLPHVSNAGGQGQENVQQSGHEFMKGSDSNMLQSGLKSVEGNEIQTQPVAAVLRTQGVQASSKLTEEEKRQSPLFKMPFPVTSKKTKTSSKDGSQFKSRIPRHVTSTSLAKGRGREEGSEGVKQMTAKSRQESDIAGAETQQGVQKGDISRQEGASYVFMEEEKPLRPEQALEVTDQSPWKSLTLTEHTLTSEPLTLSCLGTTEPLSPNKDKPKNSTKDSAIKPPEQLVSLPGCDGDGNLSRGKGEISQQFMKEIRGQVLNPATEALDQTSQTTEPQFNTPHPYIRTSSDQPRDRDPTPSMASDITAVGANTTSLPQTTSSDLPYKPPLDATKVNQIMQATHNQSSFSQDQFRTLSQGQLKTLIMDHPGSMSTTLGQMTMESLSIQDTKLLASLMEITLPQQTTLQQHGQQAHHPSVLDLSPSTAEMSDNRQLDYLADSVRSPGADDIQMQTLVAYDTSQLSVLSGRPSTHHQAMLDKFASSTPMQRQAGDKGKLASFHMDKTEPSILPALTPRQVINLVDLPDELTLSEVCCVSLSSTTCLPIKNLLPRGVKCSMTITSLTVSRDGQSRHSVNPAHSPFDLKREVTLAPESSQNIVIIFRPKDQGLFCATLEVVAFNIMRPGEKRVYTLPVTAEAEFPTLQMSPASEVMDFGDVLWGTTGCRSLRIRNVGRATVPLCLSIFRRDSSLCSFSFHPEDQSTEDVSRISLTNRPPGSSSIYSLTLPGKLKDDPQTEEVKVYCKTLTPSNLERRYLEKAERFEALLTLAVDQPVREIAPLSEVSLKVNVGLYKLHVDKAELNISAYPGQSSSASVKLINSGSIPMPVEVSLEPHRDHFTISPSGRFMVPPAGGTVPVSVTFTPQPAREEKRDHQVNLMFYSELTNHFIPVCGKLRMNAAKISCSTTHLAFGAQRKEKLFVVVDRDTELQISITKPLRAFMLLHPETEAVTESFKLMAKAGHKHVVWVTFDPDATVGYTAKLVIQELYANRYTIHLSGYGGSSRLRFDHLNHANTGSFWIDMGQLSPGQTFFHKFSVTNTGDRCGFFKVTFSDANKIEFQPTKATVMPSADILPPGESVELLVSFSPSHKEIDLCRANHNLVAIIRVEYGDNIAREMFLRYPDQQPRQVVSQYDIPVSSQIRAVVDKEMADLRQVPDSYSLLRKSLQRVKIGLFGLAMDIDTRNSLDIRPELEVPISIIRPALTQVSSNIDHRHNSSNSSDGNTSLSYKKRKSHQEKEDDMGPDIVTFSAIEVGSTCSFTYMLKNTKQKSLRWQLTPFAPAYVKISADANKVERVTSYSVFKLCPTDGTLLPGESQQIIIKFCPETPGSFNQAWSVLDAAGQHIHRFIIYAETLAPTPALLPPSATAVPAEKLHNGRAEASVKHTEPVGKGQVRASTGSQGQGRAARVNSELTRHSAESIRTMVRGEGEGRDGPGGRELRASWSKVDGSSGLVYTGRHSQTSAADPHISGFRRHDGGDVEPVRGPSPAISAISRTSSTRDQVFTNSRGASPANLANISRASSVVSTTVDSVRANEERKEAKAVSSPSSVTSALSANQSPRSTSSRRGPETLHLVHTNLEFPSLTVGSSNSHKIYIKNQTSQDAQIRVEHEPQPPFLIKHLSFKVSAQKIVIFPVTFKPRHADKFRDKIVFRDLISGVVLTSTLEAVGRES